MNDEWKQNKSGQQNIELFSEAIKWANKRRGLEQKSFTNQHKVLRVFLYMAEYKMQGTEEYSRHIKWNSSEESWELQK